MSDKKKLGRGLNSIFGENVTSILDEIQESANSDPSVKQVQIPVNEIRPNPYQPRKEFDQEALKELSESIKEHGIFTPLLVRKGITGYDLVAGERRLRAAKIAGLEKVPAIIVEFADDEMMEIALLENIQRENLNPIEEAQAYESLLTKLNYTQEKLAQRVGKSREYCANMLRLLKLPVDIRQLVIDKKLTMGHVRPLITLKDDEQMEEVADAILTKKLSVREVEKYVKELKEGKPKKKQPKPIDPFIEDIQNRMVEKFGTSVTISNKEIKISYHNTEDLNRLLELLNCVEESEND